ncbi:MAG TPA: aldehyde dehydrogenase family protein [Candidatus Acidoferrales bacterium]|jgi:acyl-CoA reductase-like NAD-dependent aldehyde dehydrogenase|nr:aldehyde dehydrogenase family protein [Candidatus Acidoferrales bacterium]
MALETAHKSAGRDSLPVRNPRTGEIDMHITPPSGEEIAATCAKLRQAQEPWGRAPVAHRIEVMNKWAQRIEAHKEDLIRAESIDTGGGQISHVAPDMVLGSIRRASQMAPAIFEQARRHGSAPGMPHVQCDTNLRPYPLAGIIGPWNAPMMLSTLHAIPALFAGCAVIVKPSEVTPRFVAPMMETILEVPELASVLIYVVGDGRTGEAIIENADIINFTGSVPNGRKVAEACAKRFIPSILELGGKDPVIITEDADLDRAAKAVLRGAASSTGQVCFSIERIYVHEKAHDPFVERLVKEAERVELTYPDPNRGQIGPFTSGRQAEIVDDHLDDAVAKGAVIRTGGKSENLGGGLYMRPTVLTGVTHEMKIMKDETFGPVMPVMKFGTVDEAVRLANDTYYGLSAAVIAGSAEEARRIGDRLDAGMVSLQDTFLTFAGFAFGLQADSFRFSGMGSRAGIMAHLRRQGVVLNTGEPACLIEEKLHAVG